MDPKAKSTVFGTRFGFYLAAIGSAFGLGNLWRFPYVAAENGGGAFVILYLFLTFLIGMPFLIAELMLGKVARNSLTPALMKLNGERYQVRELRQMPVEQPPWVQRLLRFSGIFSLLITVVVLAYYAVISGWVLHFFMQLMVSVLNPNRFHPEGSLKVLLENGWLQLLLTSVHLLTVAVIVAKDLEFGLEKVVGYCMSVFAILLLVLAVESLSLPSAQEAMRFLLYPNFSKLTLESLGQALGHVFFTLSIGFGSMVTFGSYLREKAYLPMAGFRVSTLDSMISVWAGVMIFPLVVYGGSQYSGPQLLFQTVPHKGNWMIDVANKKIYALDFGQLEWFDPKHPFLYDPRLVIVDFLNAISKKDARALYYAMVNMRKPGTNAPPLTQALQDDIAKALNNPSYKEAMIELLTTVTEAGIDLDRRYSFGAMKGLITLFGEKYVDDDTFKKIITEEARNLALKKTPAILVKKVNECTAQFMR